MIIHNMTEMTAVHSNTSLNPEPAPPQIMLFDRFQYGNSHLRVHHEELRKIRCQHNLLATMWFSLSAPLLAATVSTWMGLSVPQNVTQSWILAITALSCIFPPLIASFVFRSFSGWVPFIQLATTFYLTAAFSLNTVLHATDFIYLAIPSAVIFTLSIFLTDDRIATKVFQVDLVLQVILIALKLDQRITWTWDIALFPTFGAYIVLFSLTEGAFFLLFDGACDVSDRCFQQPCLTSLPQARSRLCLNIPPLNLVDPCPSLLFLSRAASAANLLQHPGQLPTLLPPASLLLPLSHPYLCIPKPPSEHHHRSHNPASSHGKDRGSRREAQTGLRKLLYRGGKGAQQQYQPS